MTKPTADSTAAAESWVRSHRDLQALVDQAPEVPEAAEALVREDIPPAEARAAIVDDPNVVARCASPANGGNRCGRPRGSACAPGGCPAHRWASGSAS